MSFSILCKFTPTPNRASRDNYVNQSTQGAKKRVTFFDGTANNGAGFKVELIAAMPGHERISALPGMAFVDQEQVKCDACDTMNEAGASRCEACKNRIETLRSAGSFNFFGLECAVYDSPVGDADNNISSQPEQQAQTRIETPCAVLDAVDADADVWDIDNEPLEPFTPSELEEIEAEKLALEARWLREASGVTREYREAIEITAGVEGVTIDGYIETRGATCDGVAALARRQGFNELSWNDPRNSRRRRQRRELKADRFIMRQRVAQAVAARKELASAPVAAPFAPVKTAPAAPKVTPLDVQGNARVYADSLTQKHPARAAKLQKSLMWQLSEYEPTLDRLTGKGKTQQEAAAIWLKGARAAFDAKVA